MWWQVSAGNPHVRPRTSKQRSEATALLAPSKWHEMTSSKEGKMPFQGLPPWFVVEQPDLFNPLHIYYINIWPSPLVVLHPTNERPSRPLSEAPGQSPSSEGASFLKVQHRLPQRLFFMTRAYRSPSFYKVHQASEVKNETINLIFDHYSSILTST